MKRLKKMLVLLQIVLLVGMVARTVNASTINGGDAASQASATSIVDIMFLIDTSGSMYDDIAAIGAAAQSAITTLQCPDCDVYVRADFMGIRGTYGSVFNQSYDALYPTTQVDHSEDNGWGAWAAITAADGTWWTNDAASGQNYYRAVVTIGDEGTDNGHPVYQSDWDAAYAANQAAIANGVFLFSWVTNDPTSSSVVPLFQAMATGGTGGGYTFGNTGGGFINDAAGTGNVTTALQDIVCTTAGGGSTPVPEPSTFFLLGSGLVGLAGMRRRFKA